MTKSTKPEESIIAPTNVSLTNYRYFCDGCTGIALITTNKMVGITITCNRCGKVQTTKLENFLEA